MLVTLRIVPDFTVGRRRRRGRYNLQLYNKQYCRRDSYVHKEAPPEAGATPELSNRFFKNLLSERWEVFHVPQTDIKLFKSHKSNFYLYKMDLMFK